LKHQLRAEKFIRFQTMRMNFSSKERTMKPKQSPLTVVLEPIFVRDHQRRLRLVIDLLEQELRRHKTPPESAADQTQPESPRTKAASHNNTGGHQR
jgi:hypothetical protein